ncbi:hypothetical protein L9F63_011680, partial [Diploptera punctata]
MNMPLIADKSGKLARSYGVLNEDTGVPYRGLFIIDGKQNLRQITVNDLPVGRSVDETLRLVQAFQFTDLHGEVCPANWKPGTLGRAANIIINRRLLQNGVNFSVVQSRPHSYAKSGQQRLPGLEFEGLLPDRTKPPSLLLLRSRRLNRLGFEALIVVNMPMFAAVLVDGSAARDAHKTSVCSHTTPDTETNTTSQDVEKRHIKVDSGIDPIPTCLCWNECPTDKTMPDTDVPHKVGSLFSQRICRPPCSIRIGEPHTKTQLKKRSTDKHAAATVSEIISKTDVSLPPETASSNYEGDSRGPESGNKHTGCSVDPSRLHSFVRSRDSRRGKEKPNFDTYNRNQRRKSPKGKRKKLIKLSNNGSYYTDIMKRAKETRESIRINVTWIDNKVIPSDFTLRAAPRWSYKIIQNSKLLYYRVVREENIQFVKGAKTWLFVRGLRMNDRCHIRYEKIGEKNPSPIQETKFVSPPWTQYLKTPATRPPTSHTRPCTQVIFRLRYAVKKSQFVKYLSSSRSHSVLYGYHLISLFIVNLSSYRFSKLKFEMEIADLKRLPDGCFSMKFARAQIILYDQKFD